MRIRSLSLVLAFAAAAGLLLVPRETSAARVATVSPPTAVQPAVMPTVGPIYQMVTMRAPAPARGTRVHLSPLLGFAVAGATKKKAAPTRRAKGVAVPDVPMLLDTDVHVMRDDEMVIISGGVLLEDTELDDDEIEDLTKRGVIRPATPAEITRLAQAASDAERATLERQQAGEIQALRAKHAVETQAAADTSKSDDAKAKLAEKQSGELASLQQQHAAALNK